MQVDEADNRDSGNSSVPGKYSVKYLSMSKFGT
jgi:hypothetical protein